MNSWLKMMASTFVMIDVCDFIIIIQLNYEERGNHYRKEHIITHTNWNVIGMGLERPK